MHKFTVYKLGPSHLFDSNEIRLNRFTSTESIQRIFIIDCQAQIFDVFLQITAIFVLEP